MSGNYVFKWPKGPEDVIVTGEFDNWKQTLPLVKQADGSFELSVPFTLTQEKLLYKYVVDGEWLVSKTHNITNDEAGNENNYISKNELVASSTSAKIPEAGGLAAAVVGSKAVNDVKATVMPTEETEHTQQKTLGEPGIVIPKDQEQLKAFETVRDVDPKTLNEPELTPQEKKKLKKKVKRTQYKAKKKAQNNAADSSSSNNTPEPEKTPAAAAAAIAVAKGPEAIEGEAAPVAATELPQTKDVVPEVTDVQPEAKENEPEADTKTKSEEAAGIAAGAVAGTVAGAAGIAALGKDAEATTETTAAETLDTAPVVPVTEESVDPIEVRTPIDEAQPEAVVESDEVTKTLDPKVGQEESEISAVPVAAPVEDATEKVEADEEIVIAQGDVTQKQVADEIHAQEGKDVTVEEFKPTEEEAKKLTEEAGASTAKTAEATTTKAEAATTKAEAATTKAAPKDKKKKKDNIFKRFFKKLAQ
jgi:hypothetical protein